MVVLRPISTYYETRDPITYRGKRVQYISEIQYSGKVERTGNACIILREILLADVPFKMEGVGITPRDGC